MPFAQFPFTPLANDVSEADLILAAQAGDEEAALTLIRAYIPGLSAQLRRFRTVYDEAEDAEQEILTGFLEHLHAIDVTEDSTCGGFTRGLTVSYRRLKAQRNGFGGIRDRAMVQYDHLMKRATATLPADASEDEILAVVGDLIANSGRERGSRISRADFLAIHRAVNTPFAALDNVDLPEDVEEELAEEYATVRDCIAALPNDQQAAVRYAYGFELERTLTDAEIVEEWSRDTLPPSLFEAGERITSRQTLQRRRRDALKSLRASFALAMHGA